MKRNYQKPAIEVIVIDNDQIILCSSVDPSIITNDGLSDIHNTVETLK